MESKGCSLDGKGILSDSGAAGGCKRGLWSDLLRRGSPGGLGGPRISPTWGQGWGHGRGDDTVPSLSSGSRCLSPGPPPSQQGRSAPAPSQPVSTGWAKKRLKKRLWENWNCSEGSQKIGGKEEMGEEIPQPVRLLEILLL